MIFNVALVMTDHVILDFMTLKTVEVVMAKMVTTRLMLAEHELGDDCCFCCCWGRRGYDDGGGEGEADDEDATDRANAGRTDSRNVVFMLPVRIARLRCSQRHQAPAFGAFSFSILLQAQLNGCLVVVMVEVKL